MSVQSNLWICVSGNFPDSSFNCNSSRSSVAALRFWRKTSRLRQVFFGGKGAMIRLLSRAAMLLALFLPPLMSGAEAGVGERAGEAVCAWKRWSPIARAQYYVLDDEDYCWYDDGWHGPGWYWCGYEGYEGYGWGGPYGWNGWGGGYSIRGHRRHGVGVWRAGPPARRLSPGPPAAGGFPAGGAPASRHFGAVGAPARPGLTGGVQHQGGAPAFHGAQGDGGFHGFGAPASPGFQAGGAPAFHGAGGGFGGLGGGGGFHGGGGFQGFGGGGGFHGGGGAFTGGHGGGHR
jgi:hypothetical protein